jgi:hypothetical protein
MEETIFTRALGNSPKLKVLEFLIEGKDFDYSISDIAEGSGIGRTTLFRIWEDFIRLKIVIHTREIGNAKLFRLNTKNTFVKKMCELYNLIVIAPLKEEKQVKTITS